MSKLSAHLRTLRRSIPQLEREIATQVVAKEAAKFHAENFRSESFEGSRWAKRKKKDSSRKLLVKSGRLKRGATSPKTKGNVVDFIMPIYGKYHNDGAGHLPKRQFFGLSPKLKAELIRKAQILITKRLNRR